MQEHLARVHAALDRAPAKLAWAKLELLLGLSSAALGLTLASSLPALAVPLVALGGYLALAGHRSHLYDAMSRQTAITWRRLEELALEPPRAAASSATPTSKAGAQGQPSATGLEAS